MRKLLFMIFVALTFLLSNSSTTTAYEKEIKNLSTSIAENIVNAGKKTVAVVDFTDLQGNITELGRFLAEELSVDLTMIARDFNVIDRTHLKSILSEHKLSISGLVDPNTIKKLGQIAGVDAIVTGSVTPFGDSIRVTCKVIVTDTAKVIGAGKGDIAKTKAIEELLARGIESAQAFSQQPSTTSYVPSTSSPTSKKVGDIIVTVKRIMVSKGQVTVALDFSNQSDKKLILARAGDKPYLLDENGNIFEYDEGLKGAGLSWDSGYYPTLNPKSNNDVVLFFKPQRQIDIKDIGHNFSFSLKFLLYNPQDEKKSMYEVSFTDIKAQKPK